MNDLCTALADALRKCAEKWPEKFNRAGTVMYLPGGSLTLLDTLGESGVFSLDNMDAVAAALGMWFDTVHAVSEQGGDKYTARWGELGMRSIDAVEWSPDKRTASLAALYAIITHTLEEK